MAQTKTTVKTPAKSERPRPTDQELGQAFENAKVKVGVPIKDSRSQTDKVADAPASTAPATTKPSNGVRMPRINDVRIAGRLTAEPEIRKVGEQNVANFNLAVEKPYLDQKNEWQKQVSFIPVAVWGMVADRARDILHKGSPVYLEGRLRSNSWETKDGQKRSAMKLEAYKVQSLARNANRSQGQEVGD